MAKTIEALLPVVGSLLQAVLLDALAQLFVGRLIRPWAGDDIGAIVEKLFPILVEEFVLPQLERGGRKMWEWCMKVWRRWC